MVCFPSKKILAFFLKKKRFVGGIKIDAHSFRQILVEGRANSHFNKISDFFFNKSKKFYQLWMYIIISL